MHFRYQVQLVSLLVEGFCQWSMEGSSSPYSPSPLPICSKGLEELQKRFGMCGMLEGEEKVKPATIALADASPQMDPYTKMWL